MGDIVHNNVHLYTLFNRLTMYGFSDKTPPMGRMMKFKWLLFLIALILPIPEHSMRIPPPDILPAVQAPAPIKSHFLLHVDIQHATLLKRLEDAVPKSFAGEGHGKFGETITTSYNTSFTINREQLQLVIADNQIALSTHLSGHGKAVVPAHMLRPKVSVSMNTEADIGINSSVQLTPDWHIQALTTTSLHVSRAATKILGIPVSAKDVVAKALAPKMDKLAQRVTAALQAIDVRGPVEKAWKNLAKPIAIDQRRSGWLSVQPQALYYSGFTPTATGIRAVLGIDAMIEGSYGEKPMDSDVGELPELRTVLPATPGFHVNLPIFASFEYLQQPLKKAVVGKIYTLDNGATVEVQDAHLYSNGEYIVVALDVVAELPGAWLSSKGRIYFSGKPMLDVANHRLSLVDFDYDLNTKNYLLEAANQLFYDVLRDKIASQLHWDFSAQMQTAQQKANQQLHMIKLPEGGSLQGKVDTMRANGVYPLRQGLYIGAVFSGNVAAQW